MRKIWMLTISNIKKNKSQTISLLLFVLIAATVLNIGMILYFDFGKAFEERAEELHAPHTTILQSKELTTQEQYTWLEENPLIMELEKQAVIASYGEHSMNGAKASAVILFANISDKQKMNPPLLIGDFLPLDDNGIYVPYLIQAAGGYQLGDDYILNVSGKDLCFTIAGFTEEIIFGALNNQLYRYYITDGAFRSLESQIPESSCILMSGRLSDSGLAVSLQLDYAKEFFYSDKGESESSFIQSLSLQGAKSARTFLPLLMALIMTAFAIIILLVSLIVIRFSITNNIEESMTNIGALKAIGYQNKFILLSFVLQFSSIAFAGGILGILASQMLMPMLTQVLEPQSAMIWNPGFNLKFAMITLCFIVLSVLLVSFWSARRIIGLHPLTALRTGLSTHNFKKNSIPLDTSHGPLSLKLAMKQLVKSKSQSILIAIIIAAVSFTAVTGITAYYNIGVETSNFVSTIAGEAPDLAIILNNRGDNKDFIDRLLLRQEVRKVLEYQGEALLAKEVEVMTFITRDFSMLEGNMLVEGRYPIHSNEVAAGNNFLQYIDKKIGDTVMLQQGSYTKEYLITGLIQSFNNSGFNLLMTYDGLLSIQPDYEFDTLFIYLEPEANPTTFLDSFKADEGDSISNIQNTQEIIVAQFGQLGSIFAVVATGILGITAVVVVLVLFLVIKTAILRRKREFGIQKAMGFTTIQIMNQIALLYMPMIVGGVLLGGIGGVLGFNPLFALLTSSMGVVKTELPAPIGWTIVTCALLITLAYFVSMLIAFRIRKISAYSLINE